MIFTRKQVSQNWGIGIGTVVNWARGYYYRGKKKIYYLPSQEHLHFTRTDLGQPIFLKSDVTAWLKLLEKNSKQQRRVLNKTNS